MPWSPPEEDFNFKWVIPKHAWDELKAIISQESARQRYLMDRLKSGLIIAYARDHECGSRRFRFSVIPPHFWGQCGRWGDDHFWATGDQTFEFPGESTHRFLDIRFPPDWFAGSPDIEHPGTASGESPSEQSDDDRPPLSRADAEKFCKAVLAGWGDSVTQDWAFDKAVLFFPEKKVTRDAFRSILRSIRGPMKPGKRGKIDE